MTPWHLVLDGRCPPSETMERDLSLFSSVLHGAIPKALRIYNWDGPAITIGHHQKGFAPRDPNLSLPILRRPTGGGAVLHHDDLTFSISAREEGPFSGGITGACAHVSSIFARAFRACGLQAEMRGGSAAFSEVCFMRSSPVELCVGGEKALGLACSGGKGTSSCRAWSPCGSTQSFPPGPSEGAPRLRACATASPGSCPGTSWTPYWRPFLPKGTSCLTNAAVMTARSTRRMKAK